MLFGIAPVERVLGALAERGGRGHVTAGLAEHAVVEHEAGDALAARGGVQHLLESFVDHVAVALDGDHQRVGLGPLHAGGERRRATVQRLQHLDVEVVGERRVAADPDDADRPRHRVDRLDALEDGAHGDRFATPRAQAVLADVDQRRGEVVDQVGGFRRRCVGGEEALGHGPTFSSRSSWRRSRT